MNLRSKKILITAALPYVNNIPHLGNLIGCVLSADVFARFCRSSDKKTLFICGTDEFGSATEFAAKKVTVSCQELCDSNFKRHQNIYKFFNISFDNFGRTSASKYHTQLTQNIFEVLYRSSFEQIITQQESSSLKNLSLDNPLAHQNPGPINLNRAIFQKEIEQFRCLSCDTPLADRFVVGTCYSCAAPNTRGDQCDSCSTLINPLKLLDPRCNLCQSSPVKYTTTHYYLNYSALEPLLRTWLDKKLAQTKGPHRTVPENNKEEMPKEFSYATKITTRSFLKKQLKPRCITRDLKWGVPLPDLKDSDQDTEKRFAGSSEPSQQASIKEKNGADKSAEEIVKKVFYVWFDAPIGYLSITMDLLGERGLSDWWLDPSVELWQFMGKDNVPFHTIFFPSVLLAVNNSEHQGRLYKNLFLEEKSGHISETGKFEVVLPTQVSTTHYLLYENTKFSKSNNVGVFGEDAIESGLPSDVWRFYLLRIRPEQGDTQFLWKDFQTKVNDELLNNIGNLVARLYGLAGRLDNILSFTHSSWETSGQKAASFKADFQAKYKEWISLMEEAELKKALSVVLEMSSLVNAEIHKVAPWTLIKEGKSSGSFTLARGWIGQFWVAMLVVMKTLNPFLPDLTKKVFGISQYYRCSNSLDSLKELETKILESSEDEKIEGLLNGLGERRNIDSSLQPDIDWRAWEGVFRLNKGLGKLVSRIEDKDVERFKGKHG